MVNKVNTGIEESIIRFRYYGLVQDPFPADTEYCYCNDDVSDWPCTSGLLPMLLFMFVTDNGHRACDTTPLLCLCYNVGSVVFVVFALAVFLLLP